MDASTVMSPTGFWRLTIAIVVAKKFKNGCDKEKQIILWKCMLIEVNIVIVWQYIQKKWNKLNWTESLAKDFKLTLIKKWACGFIAEIIVYFKTQNKQNLQNSLNF